MGSRDLFARIDTPAVVIDVAQAERNIRRFQDYANAHGLKLRPHIKTHKLPFFAKAQIAAGAIGITCQKIGEAEVMADAGLTDILITYNILGAAKVLRLAALARRCKLSVVADNSAVVDGLSSVFTQEPAPLEVLVECDTGAGRCGVQNAEEVVALARRIAAAPGLTFGGLMTYPPMRDEAKVDAWLRAAQEALLAAGLPCSRISSGGTPNMWRAHDIASATEHRAGTYIYNDRSLIKAGVAKPEDCALSVLATVVSRPTETRAIIDAGTKTLTSDLLGLSGYGHVVEAPEARIVGLSEEHGTLDLSATDWRPEVGDRLRIIPNHACVVSNMVDSVWLLQDGKVTEEKVAARGKIT
jgi:D-serine deaminase-like pyridoxal phosphate-dependent protein